MRTTVHRTLSDITQTAALFRALAAAGIGGPTARDGLRVAYDPAGIVTVDADRDVTDFVAGWTPTPTQLERAHTLLDAYLQIYRDGGTPTAAQTFRAVKVLAALALADLDEAN